MGRLIVTVRIIHVHIMFIEGADYDHLKLLLHEVVESFSSRSLSQQRLLTGKMF